MLLIEKSFLKVLSSGAKSRIKRISRIKKGKYVPNLTKICTVYFFIFFVCIPKKVKSNIDQSKKENIIKTEEESILYGFKNQCENNFMKSEEKEIHSDTAASSHKIQKRKRTKQLLNYK